MVRYYFGLFRGGCGQRVAGSLLWLVALPLAPRAQAVEPGSVPTTCQAPVSYVTADLTYLSNGSAEGIAPGDTGTVRRGDTLVARIEVSHVASHSASCRLIESLGSIRVGDTAFVCITPASGEDSPVLLEPEMASDAPVAPSRVNVTSAPSRQTRLNGMVSVRVSHFISNPAIDRDYTLSHFGLNIRARDLWGRNLELTVRTSGRGNYRSSPAGSSRLDSEWSGRISTFSLAYSSEQSGTSLQAGRVPVSRLGRLGGIDGLVIEQSLSDMLRVGVFAGLQPRWQYAEDRLATQKAGAYLGWHHGNRQNTMADLAVGAAGEYHNGTPSREMLMLQGRVSNRRWSLNQSAEIDVNRGWRHENSGRTLALSGVYLSARYRVAPWLAGNVSYDSRRDYWTYEKRSLADSLFDDNLRQGLRGQADLSLPMRSTLTVGMGYRNRAGDADPTVSYTAGLRSSGIGTGRLSVSLLGTGFDGPTEDGYDVSTHAGASVLSQTYVDLGTGYYAYRSVYTDSQRNNRWVEGTIRSTIFERLVTNLGYRISDGDDVSGHRFEVGLTRPF